MTQQRNDLGVWWGEGGGGAALVDHGFWWLTHFFKTMGQ